VVYLIDVADCNQLLTVMQHKCIYFLHDLCWEKCPARSYCLPDEIGLTTVPDLPKPKANQDQTVNKAWLEQWAEFNRVKTWMNGDPGPASSIIVFSLALAAIVAWAVWG